MAHVEMMINPFIVPGGKALAYAYSLRIWLTARKSKSSYVISENGYRIGSETKCTLKKSRFGTEGRECSIKLLWGGDTVHVQDDDAWVEIIKNSEHVVSGPWMTLKYSDGTEDKFRSAAFSELLSTNPKFRNRILEIVEDELITRFDEQKGNASNYYNIDNSLEGVVTEE